MENSILSAIYNDITSEREHIIDRKAELRDEYGVELESIFGLLTGFVCKGLGIKPKKHKNK